MYEHGSHPVWVRGLKLNQLRKKTVYVVAPRVGAWIETSVPMVFRIPLHVAPRVGAWIETPFLCI